MSTVTQETFALGNSAGDSLSLSGAGIYVVEHEGLGRAKPERAVQQGPYQHGQTLVSSRLTARTVTLKMLFKTTTESLMWALVDSVLAMLTRDDVANYLTITLPDGRVRRLYCYYNDGLTLPRKAEDNYGELNDALQLIADDPLLYDPLGYEKKSSAGSAWLGGMAIPTPIPTTIGSYSWTGSITYPGTWISLPRMRLRGPIANWRIENASTGEVLSGVGDTIADGAYYDFDCRYGYKTLEDNGGISQIEKLSSDSELATFHIAPDPEADGGVNNFTIMGSGVGTNTLLEIWYDIVYVGL